MSGHSKWATTKHKKAAIDAKRGKLFAKLIKNIEVAARTGGGDPSGNPTLYDAIQKAKKNSVPNDNIDRAVKRGSGEGADAVNYETIMYEAYAPGSVAMLIECLTDNRNRAAAEVEFRAGFAQPVELEDARKIAKITELLEDLDDVQNVYTNADITPELAAALEEDED